MRIRLALLTMSLISMVQSVSAGEIIRAQASGAGASSAAASDGAFFKIIEHRLCNEIKTKVPKGSGRYFWRPTSEGGSYTVESGGMTALKENLIDDVRFGKRAMINFKLNGKSVVPSSLQADERFSTSFNSLMDDQNQALVGKFMALTDIWSKTGFQDDETGEKKEKIQLAVFYYQPDEEKAPATVSCSYVGNGVDLREVERKNGCIWIDSKSRAGNGKPYCW